jgi:hypothetical protein
MTGREQLQDAFVTLEVDESFAEAVVALRDQSRLCFCHRVDERWAKAFAPAGREQEGGIASELLAEIARFRLNGKHLDIQFADGSRWEFQFKEQRR